jgi:MIP family channel proteins
MDDVLMGDAVAELVGAFTLTLFAAGSVVVDATATGPQADLGLPGIAAVTGVGYALAVALSRPRSGGHVNPAVSLAAWLTARVSALRAGTYVLAQLAGGVLAAAAVVSLAPEAALDQARAGATTVPASTEALTALTWEIVITFVYTLVVFVTVLDGASAGSGALAAGGAAFAALALAYPFTGASMNPARSLGPALLGSTWGSHWVYWVGPVLGAAVAGGLHDGLLREVATDADDG